MKDFEITPRDLGTVVHEIVADYTLKIRHYDAPETLEDWLREKLASVPPKQAADALYNVKAFLEREQYDLLEPTEVLVEQQLAAVIKADLMMACEFNDSEADLRGIVDRMDFYGETILEITDYKTGWGGHDRLQGLIYAVLAFVNYPQLEIVRVRFANPLSNYISDYYELVWDEDGVTDDGQTKVKPEITSLIATLQQLRANGYDKPLSYSGLKTFYRCPASFWHKYVHDAAEPSGFWTYRPGSHCSLCEAVMLCEHAPLAVPNNAEEVKDLLSVYVGLEAKCAVAKELLKAWCEENGDVEVGDTYCGFKASWPAPKVQMGRFINWLQDWIARRDSNLPEVELDRYLQLRKSKAVDEALHAYRQEGNEVKQKNASLRFMFGSEAE